MTATRRALRVVAGGPSIALLLFIAACRSEPRVARVYDGKIVEGRFVPPDAYSAFLRGVLAEESGDLKGAATAYAQALDEDDDDPEISVRIGEARCKLDPRDPEVDRAFQHALALDGNNASALAAKSRCATARGRIAEGGDLAAKAAAADPANVGLAALAIRADVPRGDPAARERAVALTTAHGEHVAAWDALIAWGNAHHDVALVVRGLEGLVRVAPARSVELEKGALVLLAVDPPLAHRLAVAVSDAPRALGVVGPRDATVARLAVDDALARGDKTAALARATRGHVPLPEVAARALLLDRSDLALAIATSVVDADPSSSGALMVMLALRPAPAARASAPPAAIPGALADPRDQPPELCALVFADRLAQTLGVETAKAWLAKVTRTTMPERDPLGIALTRSLATRGVLSAPLHVAQ